ncbi:MAG TPA: DUF924 family protein [Hyphomicrobiales bacterium]|nr:DUF924 domain-containing protein [Rhodobiaceae bacterium]HXK54147.1 DUF924 family protein [Hyphomicrobiales bacterium]
MNSEPQTLPGPDEVLRFWRQAGSGKWFSSDPDFDAEIARRFAALNKAAVAGRCDDWAQTAPGALALILVIDQFSRNLFRGEATAFAGDGKALEVARQAIAQGFDKGVEKTLRSFFYMPFMHAEDMAEQERSVALFEALDDPVGLDFARQHADIIARFGRFPHRNKALGRPMLAEEQEFLDQGGFSA